MTPGSTRTAGRAIGALILSAFGLYGGGTALVKAGTSGRPPVPENAVSPGRLATGATLVLTNSVAVAVVGVLGFRVLRHRARRAARVYLCARLAEATLLALPPAGTLALLTAARRGVDTSRASGRGRYALARAAVERSEPLYWIAMSTLGVGSVVFCRALLDGGLMPRPLAVWGTAGYAVFATGGVLQLAGHDVGLPFSVPGGLFEVVGGTYLAVEGFDPAADALAAG